MTVIELELLSKDVALQAEKVLPQLEEYITSECPLRKAEIIKFVKERTSLKFVDLEQIVFESTRTLVRYFNLNNLVPELREMLQCKEIAKPIAYALSVLSEEEQLIHYKALQELLLIKLESLNTLLESDVKSKRSLNRHYKRFTKVNLVEYKDLVRTNFIYSNSEERITLLMQ